MFRPNSFLSIFIFLTILIDVVLSRGGDHGGGGHDHGGHDHGGHDHGGHDHGHDHGGHDHGWGGHHHGSHEHGHWGHGGSDHGNHGGGDGWNYNRGGSRGPGLLGLLGFGGLLGMRQSYGYGNYGYSPCSGQFVDYVGGIARYYCNCGAYGVSYQYNGCQIIQGK